MANEIELLEELITRETNEINIVNDMITKLNEKKFKHGLKVSSYELALEELRSIQNLENERGNPTH